MVLDEALEPIVTVENPDAANGMGNGRLVNGEFVNNVIPLVDGDLPNNGNLAPENQAAGIIAENQNGAVQGNGRVVRFAEPEAEPRL